MHERYQKFQAFEGVEKADFEYDDNKGCLTSYLEKLGHHEAAKWAMKPPMYYIETKATSQDFSAAFQMSNHQHEMVCYFLHIQVYRLPTRQIHSNANELL